MSTKVRFGIVFVLWILLACQVGYQIRELQEDTGDLLLLALCAWLGGLAFYRLVEFVVEYYRRRI